MASAITHAADAAPLSRAEVLALVASDLEKIEKVIELDTVCSVEAVTAISQYLQASGGKRLRPLLVLLSARACGFHGEAAVRLGAVTEIVHAATLVHDDVIDGADVRRGRPSVNRRWGNQVSVLAGDWLYMQAFNLTLRERNLRLLDLLIDLTQTMVQGELQQAEMAGRIDVTAKEHLDLIHSKTASLFSVCCRFGAHLAAQDRALEDRLGDYGWNLGMAFQLIDDILDFAATEEVLGKPVGNDLREGKVTLPLILALSECEPAEREKVRTVIREAGYQTVSAREIRQILTKYRTLETVRRQAVDYTETAIRLLQPLPASRHKRALLSIADWIVDRES